MDHRTPSTILRLVAGVGALLTFAATIWSLWTGFAFSTGAPMGWRVQAVLADSWPLILLTIGFALAAGSHRVLRRIGWGMVFLTIIGGLLWTWSITTASPPVVHTAVVSFTLHTALRAALAIGATLAVLDADLRTQYVDTIYRSHSKRLFTYALYLSRGNVPVAEDIVQELFLTLQSGTRDEVLQRDDGAVKAHCLEYVKQFFQTTDRGNLRRIRHETEAATEYADNVSTFEQDQDLAEFRSAVKAALEHLPPRTVEAFSLIYEIGLSYTEAAKIMGIAVATVRVHVKNACEWLRPYLSDWDPDAMSRILRSPIR